MTGAHRLEQVDVGVGIGAGDDLGLDKATHLFVAVPNPFEASRIIEQARAANPATEIIARAYTDADVLLLKQMGATHALIGEEEIAKGMLAKAPRKKPAASGHH